MGLHDQDFIHNGKKLINPIDSHVGTLQLGSDVVTLTHLGLVYNKFNCDQHGLKLEDTNRKDRQNWASAQRICQKRTRDCLAKLRMSKEVHQERTLGTELYLEVCSNYIDIFLSPRLNLRSRIVLASKVYFFSVFGNYGFNLEIIQLVGIHKTLLLLLILYRNNVF